MTQQERLSRFMAMLASCFNNWGDCDRRCKLDSSILVCLISYSRWIGPPAMHTLLNVGLRNWWWQLKGLWRIPVAIGVKLDGFWVIVKKLGQMIWFENLSGHMYCVQHYIELGGLHIQLQLDLEKRSYPNTYKSHNNLTKWGYRNHKWMASLFSKSKHFEMWF